MAARKTLLSIFGIEPLRIGSGESFIRELSAALGERGWNHVVCLAATMPLNVHRFLDAPNVCFEIVERPWAVTRQQFRQVSALMKRHRPEILHLHYTSFLGPYPWLAKFRGVKRIYFTDHTSPPENHVIRPRPAWKQAIANAITHPLTGLISVSDYGRRCMVDSKSVPARKVKRIYNAIDLNRITTGSGAAFRQRFGIPEDRAVVGQVSWIIPAKGIGDLLDAAKLVVSQNPNVQFVFVGEGANRAEYTDKAAAMGLGGHVTWTGMVQDPMGEGVFAAADVVCQVSRWNEVFGWTITEAMATCRPVIGTDVGGIPEVIADGETGYIVPKGDTSAMAERILRLIRDPELRRRMGEAGRRRVEQNFSLPDRIRELLDFYEIR